jgi:hypothetical protein
MVLLEPKEEIASNVNDLCLGQSVNVIVSVTGRVQTFFITDLQMFRTRSILSDFKQTKII